METTSSFACLPRELQEHVISFVPDVTTLGRCIQVCQTWTKLTLKGPWMNLFPGIEKVVSPDKSFSEFVRAHKVTLSIKYQELPEIVKEFSKEVFQQEEKRSLSCLFPFHPNCSLSISYNCPVQLPQISPDELYILCEALPKETAPNIPSDLGMSLSDLETPSSDSGNITTASFTSGSIEMKIKYPFSTQGFELFTQLQETIMDIRNGLEAIEK